jgi:tRNA(fMet)-specific endonuclease VapC
LLDTNTVIYFFKNQGAVASKLLQQRPSSLGVSAVTLHELEVGLAKSADPDKRRTQLSQFLRVVATLPLDASAAIASATLRADLEARGEPIGPLDTLIAGTAIAAGATLVTRNRKEFSRVRGLRMVDWY